jgi:hypothetical protein
MFLPGYGPIAIADWSIIVQCHLLVKMPSIGQTWSLASIGAVIEVGVLSTLKRLPMESKVIPALNVIGVLLFSCLTLWHLSKLAVAVPDERSQRSNDQNKYYT